MIERAPCIQQDHAMWFWELWTRGPFVLTDTAVFEIWNPERLGARRDLPGCRLQSRS